MRDGAVDGDGAHLFGPRGRPTGQGNGLIDRNPGPVREGVAQRVGAQIGHHGRGVSLIGIKGGQQGFGHRRQLGTGLKLHGRQVQVDTLQGPSNRLGWQARQHDGTGTLSQRIEDGLVHQRRIGGAAEHLGHLPPAVHIATRVTTTHEGPLPG
ncbi:Uncharacterised protein [Mycobacteroides abscessus subsp. abscessus]|nr:Uncharacterised protein [Mycobacteroides abscessus subsp. abscessus]SKU72229.1 Uncharacterised protein [Mycobacteroides abscessus subsp. abscessus]